MTENPNVICNDCGYCKQNKQLKELLKRAKEVLEDEGDYMIVQVINQALGEDK